jgi:hypothetical protein
MEVPGVVEADALEAALFRELRPDLRHIVRSDVGTLCIGEDKPLFVKGDVQQDGLGCRRRRYDDHRLVDAVRQFVDGRRHRKSQYVPALGVDEVDAPLVLVGLDVPDYLVSRPAGGCRSADDGDAFRLEKSALGVLHALVAPICAIFRCRPEDWLVPVLRMSACWR